MQRFFFVKMNTSEIIKKAGLKVTPQRKMVYELMTELCHSSIDELIAMLQQKDPEITVSTVYRILEAFCEAGLSSRIKNPNGKDYFDISPSEHHHVFINSEVIDYIDPELTEMIRSNLKGDLFKNLNIEKISMSIIASNKN